MKNERKTLILVRHAHRDTTYKEEDNGLSVKGIQQASILTEEIKNQLSKLPLSQTALSEILLLSSPKRRCIETLQPLEHFLKTPILIHPLLGEQLHREDSFQFQKRIQTFFDQWIEKNPPLTIICSHGDWIPLAIKLLVGAEREINKGEWIQIDFNQPLHQFTLAR